ncbi:MAG: 30S ribosomal protein S3 [Candidatus Staskawiczbacteria bacterium RIFCSPHIGHO2_02_FULL_34_10]|uniref:Small ribosomal subunit protein uS3 n=2 Tax=Candidatus Staskawicziibacteriota TaxID=1817916 RepID=A0A1G2HJC7_9BACT|nr:MAG: 30S ribosomal protein S3 [Candidatus Staskawiczbacteria bacterium RIFCSPHIGHO2_01_FULL_34_27]OGZ67773.1 MAG: 30S ribosomal protein S3 [Candidatus Staskawiczbacteria bacterium RIFCSPHIGHO2_02_FULL_34_10]
MTHKVHPKAFRIKGMEDFNIRGFYGEKMPQYLEEDFLIKDFLKTKLKEASVANIEIEHSANKLNIIIETARPGLIIGRGGEGVEILKKMVESKIAKNTKKSVVAKTSARQIKIDIKEIKNPWSSASLVAQMSAQQIEKRIPFRQVLKRNIERVMQNKEAKGIRMEVSGRLNGIEIARREWLTQGRMPRQTIRADIDYAQDEAHCTYGAIGVKVWIYKGDKFN